MPPAPQRNRRLLPAISRCLIASLLLIAGTAKLAAPSEGAEMSVILGIVEVTAAGALFARRLVRLGMLIAGGIAIGGSLQAVFGDTPCHCFGATLVLSRKAHMTMSCALGLLVALGLHAPSPQLEPSHQSKESS